MAWLSRVNFTASDVLSYTDLNNLGNDIRAWGGNVNGGGYTLSNVVLSASSGTMATVIGGTGTTSTLTLRSTSGVGTTGADIIFQAGNNGATEVMRLQNGGNVGIGTSSTGFNSAGLPLVIGSGSGNTGMTIYSGSSSFGSLHFADTVTTGGGSYSGYINYYHNTNSMQFGTNAIEAMRIDSSNRVGIGTTGPESKLHIAGSAGSPSISAANQIVTVHASTSGNGQTLQIGALTTAPWSTWIQGSYSNNPGFASPISLQPAGGNVGIGTSSPSFLLDLYKASLPEMRINDGVTTFQCYVASGVVMGTVSNHPMSFRINTTEQMRLDTNGYLLIGYTTSNGAYRLQVNSQIFATNATIATSDGRYKENISSIKSGLDVVGKLNPVSFTWKQHEIHNFDSGTQVGFIAQDVQEALADEPYLESVVKRNEVELKDGTKEEFYGLSDAKLIPILVKAIQELKAEIDILKARN